MKRLLAVSLFAALVSGAPIPVAEFEVGAVSTISMPELAGVHVIPAPALIGPRPYVLGRGQVTEFRGPSITNDEGTWVLDLGHYSGWVPEGGYNHVGVFSRIFLDLRFFNTRREPVTVPIQFTYETIANASFTPGPGKAHARAVLALLGQTFSGSGEGELSLVLEPNSVRHHVIFTSIDAVAIIPEPATGTLLTTALAILGSAAWGRKRRRR